MRMTTCHSEANKLYCDHCHKTVWEWRPDQDETPKLLEDNKVRAPDSWLPPADCPYCGADFNWAKLESAMEDVAEWIMTTNTEVVFG